MATNADFFAERWEYELKAFRKVLAALPADKLDYRPHERSASAGALAWQLANEQEGIARLVRSQRAEWTNTSVPEKLDDILAAWDQATENVRAALAAKDDSKWDGEANFMMGDTPVWTDSLKNLLWGFLFDMVHHRGQLSTYIRPMGGKVPAIYGPSGDEQ